MLLLLQITGSFCLFMILAGAFKIARPIAELRQLLSRDEYDC